MCAANDAQLQQAKILAADLEGRLPEQGEMYQGLAWYLYRNILETYVKGWDYDITLRRDGMFENLSPAEPDPAHRGADFPLCMGACRTRYRGLTATMEALARLMEAHGNLRHASEFREAVKTMQLED